MKSLINIEFDRETVFGDNDEHIKTKIKWYKEKVNLGSQGKKYQKKIHHTNVCQWQC